MPDKTMETPFPLIDADPHFRRVVQYMRPSDYGYWAAATAVFPSSLYVMEMVDPTRPTKRGLTSALRLGVFLGAAGGFLLAYQRSSFRFWGWTENEPEAARAATEEKPAGFGQSDMSPYIQGVAHRNSAFSQLKFSTLPWFNFVNHEHHGQGRAEERE